MLQTTQILGSRFPVARWLTIAIGTWLVASAFALHDAPAARANSAIIGACMLGVALYAMFMPAMRWLNTILAGWLIVSTFVVFEHASRAAQWNEAIAGIIVLLASLVRDVRPMRSPQTPAVR